MPNLPVTVLYWKSTAQQILRWHCCSVFQPHLILRLQFNWNTIAVRDEIHGVDDSENMLFRKKTKNNHMTGVLPHTYNYILMNSLTGRLQQGAKIVFQAILGQLFDYTKFYTKTQKYRKILFVSKRRKLV